MRNVRLDLEFAPQRRKTSLAGLPFLAAALLIFGIAVVEVGLKLSVNAQQTRVLVSKDGRTRAMPAKPGKPVRASSMELARTEFVRQTSRSLAAPWSDLLTSLEVAPANVALLSVEPSASKRSIALTAEAAGPAEMLNYLQALQSDKHLTNVALMTHQVQLQAPGKPLRFKLRASWGEAP